MKMLRCILHNSLGTAKGHRLYSLYRRRSVLSFHILLRLERNKLRSSEWNYKQNRTNFWQCGRNMMIYLNESVFNFERDYRMHPLLYFNFEVLRNSSCYGFCGTKVCLRQNIRHKGNIFFIVLVIYSGKNMDIIVTIVEVCQ